MWERNIYIIFERVVSDDFIEARPLLQVLIKDLAAKEEVDFVVVEGSLETIPTFEFAHVATISRKQNIPSTIRATEDRQFGHTVHWFLGNTTIQIKYIGAGNVDDNSSFSCLRHPRPFIILIHSKPIMEPKLLGFELFDVSLDRMERLEVLPRLRVLASSECAHAGSLRGTVSAALFLLRLRTHGSFDFGHDASGIKSHIGEGVV